MLNHIQIILKPSFLEVNICSPIINESRHISISSRINDISGLSFDQSTHVINTSINNIEITAMFFSITVIDIDHVSKNPETSSN